MASTSEHVSISVSNEADDNAGSSTAPDAETLHDHSIATESSEEPSTSNEQVTNEPVSSPTEALTGNVERLSIGNEDSAVAESEPTTTDSTAAPAGSEVLTSSTLKDGKAEEGSSEVGRSASHASSDDKDAKPTTSSDRPEPSISTSTSETPNLVESEQPEEQGTSDLPQSSEFQSASRMQAAAPRNETIADSSTPTEKPEELSSASIVDESTSPPSPPSKDPAPEIPAKHDMSATTHAAVQSPRLSTPLGRSSGQSDRAALADPDSVAAVAQAFGRDSPALRSSIDTPKRISTPTGPVQQDGTSAENEKQGLNIGDFAEGPGEASSTNRAGEGHTTASDPEKAKHEDQSKDGNSSRGGIRIGKGPPPTTQASEELPFDFNRFLEQMKHRSAQPVGEYVRSFIKGFAKKPYRTQDQVKLIFDFLDFIAARMRECDIWKNLGETDFENAKEAMEKLVMNRLYPYTFTPAVQKEGRWAVQTDDLERDRVLRQRIALFHWLSEEHLDVPVGDHSRGFIEFSIQELLKINHYKAPRDKLICILNACKVIFGMIRHLSSQENADTFIPVLIFVVLKANPEHLISNVEYISRFRNPDRLSSESGYYLSSLMGAIAFIETMDYTSLSNITQEEFEKRVEEAVSSLPEPEASSTAATGASMLAPPTTPPPRDGRSPNPNPEHQRSVSNISVSAPSGPGEEAAKALPFTPMAATLADDTRAFFLRTGEAARTGLSRPMGALGRLINEGIEGIRTPSNNDSGASTERQNSPAPPPSQPGNSGMTASTSRSKLFGGLFGSLDTSTSDSSAQGRSAGYPGQQQGGRRSMVGMDDEPQTPSTDGLMQGEFQPYNGGNAPNRVLRPGMPQRNYSIDDTMFDDESAGRRNLMTQGHRDVDYYDSDEDYDATQSAPNAAAAEQQRRRMQMQQDFGRDLPNSPSRQAGRGERLQAGRRDEIAMENAQTEQAIHRSLIDQERLGAVQADQAAQNSASVETLKSIFPTMDDGVIGMVLQGCEGNVETAIDRLLEMQ